MKIIGHAILSTLLVFLGFGCDKRSQQPQLQRVDPATLQPGPLQHEELSREQLERVANLHRIFSEVDSSPLEKWIDNFKRDIDPDSELALWERMASTYTGYCSRRNLSLDAKQDVYQVVLLRSTTPDAEKMLDYLNLKVLTPEQARDVMKSF